MRQFTVSRNRRRRSVTPFYLIPVASFTGVVSETDGSPLCILAKARQWIAVIVELIGNVRLDGSKVIWQLKLLTELGLRPLATPLRLPQTNLPRDYFVLVFPLVAVI
jgi:hypothetical protein